MTGLLDIIREAKRPERSVELCLRGDLVGEFEALDRQLREGLQSRDDSFGGSGNGRKVADRMEELRAEMRGSSVIFHLRAIGSARSTDLIAGHPPRPDEDRDKTLGYNPVAYYPALVRECCDRLERGDETVPAAEMSDADWDYLFDALSQQQYDALVNAAWALDHDSIEVPTSPLALLISQRKDESSKQHGAGESRPESSRAGSKSRSRRTSTTKKAASSGQ
jgi:hypothetical protein